MIEEDTEAQEGKETSPGSAARRWHRDLPHVCRTVLNISLTRVGERPDFYSGRKLSAMLIGAPLSGQSLGLQTEEEMGMPC